MTQRLDGAGGPEAHVVDRSYPRGVHVGITLAMRYGVLDGALGKCLLAGMEPGEAARQLAGATLVAHTERTITDRDLLLREVEVVRGCGYGTSVGELNHNNAVAAPVFGPHGEIQVLLLALGFSDQLTDENVPGVGDLLAGIAAAITAEVSGRCPAHWTAYDRTPAITPDRRTHV